MAAPTASDSSTGQKAVGSKAREAALQKFREKRKARCFTKKIRYMSRKKLAEQRPRHRGQFLKHDKSNTPSGATGGAAAGSTGASGEVSQEYEEEEEDDEDEEQTTANPAEDKGDKSQQPPPTAGAQPTVGTGQAATAA